MFDLVMPNAEVFPKCIPNLHSNLRPKFQMFIESPPWVPHALVRGGDAPVGSGDDGVSAALVSVVVAEAVLVDQRQHLAPPLVVDDPAALLRIVLDLIHFPLCVGQFLGMAKFAGVSEGAPLAEEPLADGDFNFGYCNVCKPFLRKGAIHNNIATLNTATVRLQLTLREVSQGR